VPQQLLALPILLMALLLPWGLWIDRHRVAAGADVSAPRPA
jgi:hypothetical protein